MLPSILPTTPSALANVRGFEALCLQQEQVPITTEHLFHAGLYARTVRIVEGTVFTSALVKRATVLIVDGDISVTANDKVVRFTGYHVIPAKEDRKHAFFAHRDTCLTMLFATTSVTLEEVEREFTDEAHMLVSNKSGNNLMYITNEDN